MQKNTLEPNKCLKIVHSNSIIEIIQSIFRVQVDYNNDCRSTPSAFIVNSDCEIRC